MLLMPSLSLVIVGKQDPDQGIRVSDATITVLVPSLFSQKPYGRLATNSVIIFEKKPVSVLQLHAGYM